MGLSSPAHAAACDIDADGDVDRLDIKSVVTSRNASAGSGDLRDADGDGTITVLDARICIRQCSLPGCPVIDPAAARPSDGTGQAGAAEASRIKEAGKQGRSTSGRVKTDSRSRTTVGGTEWKVARGDTLYAIGRAIFPGDTSRQARLRQDIMDLNPAVFAKGANNMAIGTLLRLPDYVAPAAAPAIQAVPGISAPKEGEATRTPEPAKAEVVPEPAPKPATTAPVAASETNTHRKVSSDTSRVESNVLISLGYSYGGEKLDYLDDSYGPAGIGVHLRLGFEQMFQQVGGYRISLGYQYSSAGDGGGSLSFKDNYLQLAYQYRSNPLVYGIGVVHSRGATLEDDFSIDYDAANGVVVYLENVGSGNLGGWGLSYTSLEIDEENGGESYDVSRAELYYSWRF